MSIFNNRDIASYLLRFMDVDSIICASSVSKGFYKAFRQDLATKMQMIFELVFEGVPDPHDVMQEVERKIRSEMGDVDAGMISLEAQYRESVKINRLSYLFYSEPDQLPQEEDLLTRRRAFTRWIGDALKSPSSGLFIQSFDGRSSGIHHFFLTSARKLLQEETTSKQARKLQVVCLKSMVVCNLQNGRFQATLDAVKQSWNSLGAEEQLDYQLRGIEHSLAALTSFTQDSQLVWKDDTVRKAICYRIEDKVPTEQDDKRKHLIMCQLTALAKLENCGALLQNIARSTIQRLLDDPTFGEKEVAQNLSVSLKAADPSQFDADEAYIAIIVNIKDGPIDDEWFAALLARFKETFSKAKATEQIDLWQFLARSSGGYLELQARCKKVAEALLADASIVWADPAIKALYSSLYHHCSLTFSKQGYFIPLFKNVPICAETSLSTVYEGIRAICDSATLDDAHNIFNDVLQNLKEKDIEDNMFELDLG